MESMDAAPTAIAPMLNLVTSIFLFADKSLLNLQRYRIIDLARRLLITSFIFFLRLLPSFIPSGTPNSTDGSPAVLNQNRPKNPEPYTQISYGVGDSGIARALSQLLTIVNTMPVSSRKYESVRSLAEKLIDENHQEENQTLREVNRTVLSAAFSRTLNQLEVALMELDRDHGGGYSLYSPDYYKLNKVLRVVQSFGDLAWSRARKSRDALPLEGNSAEKLGAELAWLAQKLACCGCSEEAVSQWASASNLAWLAVNAEPHLQGCFVKVSAFLFKQAKDMNQASSNETKKEQQRQTRMKMLITWLPFLCRASNGTDAPILNLNERAELEKVLEEIIEMLEKEDEQEQVLSQWLHHFMYCPSSDWPNLQASYSRWCTATRTILLTK